MTDKDFRYQLESPKITKRRQQKFTCPQCGKRRCFVRYVDTHDNCAYVDETVGKCDRQNNCGYHLTPKDFFRQNPGNYTHKIWTPTPRPATIWVPHDPQLVTASHSTQSTFWQWVAGDFAQSFSISPEMVNSVYDDYMIGATKRHEVIFWQVDLLGRVHTGHILPYLPNGKRDHAYEDWTHSRLKNKGVLPQNYELRQCFFGEHLLSRRPDDMVGVVESEKTAVLMAMCYPQQIWLSTSGCYGINKDKLACLRGRKAVFFPDSGCHKKWFDKLKECNVNFPVRADIEGVDDNTDLVDILLYGIDNCRLSK